MREREEKRDWKMDEGEGKGERERERYRVSNLIL